MPGEDPDLPPTPQRTQDDEPPRTLRGVGRVGSYRPADQASVTFGDATTIPEGHAGTAELDPGKWAALLWQTPWTVAMQGRF
ncbi:hypothetical protein PMG11_06415 [Penicillium brasilianum]|uniref:Uncharacterized protein n=1 Tax=Penicillium brasilianum TaxID=104259 RepID=A0A0F7TPF2_PENBI|nr:hypothetical protein PMG11_06415 [Penicillium brasilianum]